MNYRFPSLESANVNEKRVFVRCDFDVPLTQQLTNNKQQTTNADETRLISAISTIEYLLENGATVIAAGHLGRPAKQFAIDNLQLTNEDRKFSLEPIAQWFAEEFPGSSLYKTEIDGFWGWQIKRNFYILENLRFYKGEEENSSEFAQALADLADLYVNEAFGSSHRNHASIVGIAKLLPHFAGFHLQKEIKILENLIDNPRRPFTFIVGGEKIETKLPLISKMHTFADYVLVGGELADQDKILIKEQHEDITSNKALLIVADLNSEGTDVTKTSLENFLQIIARSKTIVWNGPVGVITPPNQNSKLKTQKLDQGDEGYTSLKLAEAVISSSAYKVVGGGDTVAFLNEQGLLGKFDFVSTGGGAMLEFLSGNSLPGLMALKT